MLKFDYIHLDKSDFYACITSDLVNGYIFKILNLNIPTSESYQCRNTLKWFCKRDPNGKVFNIDGRREWFTITAFYNNTTNTNSYLEVAFHKLSSIKFFGKTLIDETISIVFNKFIATLRDYEYSDQIPEALDERTCLTFHNSLMNHVANIRRHIKSWEIVENKEVGFTEQQVMNSVHDHAKVPVTI